MIPKKEVQVGLLQMWGQHKLIRRRDAEGDSPSVTLPPAPPQALSVSPCHRERARCSLRSSAVSFDFWHSSLEDGQLRQKAAVTPATGGHRHAWIQIPVDSPGALPLAWESSELPWPLASFSSMNEGDGGEQGDLKSDFHPTAKGGVVFTFKKQRRNCKERSWTGVC